MATLGTSVLLLGIGFAAVYPLARFLPSTQCAFLHYEQAEPGSGDDLCGSAETSVFLDLERLKFPVTAEITPSGAPAAGQPVNFSLNLATKAGKPIMGKDLAVVHTRRMHLFVIDGSLGDYHHLHPQQDIEGGDFSFSFIPRHGGSYRVYAEMVPLASRSALITGLSLEVKGPPAKPQAASAQPLVATQEGLRFELVLPDGGLKRGLDNDLSLHVSRADGSKAPVPFEKLMGAYCHLAAFDAAGKGFAHLHPLDKGIGLDSSQPRFGFAFNTSTAGSYRVWAQLQLNGREVFVPFDLGVP